MTPLVGLLLGLGAVAIAVAMSVQWVPANWSFTVHRRGQFLRTLPPGLHFIVPLLDRVVHKVNMGGQAVDLQCPELTSKDDVPVVANGVIYFQVLDARKAADRSASLQRTAENLTTESAREMVQQLSLTSLNERSRTELNGWLLGLVNQSAVQWGVRVTRVDLSFEPADTDRLVD